MKKKRRFTSLELTVAPNYVYPPSRGRWLKAGIGLAAVALVLGLVDLFFLKALLISNGPLSSSHAKVDDCSSCHTPFRNTADEKCVACHDAGAGNAAFPLYGMPAHFIHRSDDLGRAGKEDPAIPCADCHTEHRGRDARIAMVADARCLSCHDFGSFQSAHPPFRHSLGQQKGLEAPGMKFPHAVHIDKVLPERRKISGEETCDSCHQPDESGRGFQAIQFDRHCSDGCHLGQRASSLPTASDGIDGPAGILSPSQLAGAAPSTPCLSSINPSEFEYTPAGNPRQIRNTRLRHEDCWVVENFRILRRSARTTSGLADLLTSAPAGADSPGLLRRRYGQAIAALQDLSVGLSNRLEEPAAPPPAGQAWGSDRINGWLEQARRTLPRSGSVGPQSLLSRDAAQTAAASPRPLDRLLTDSLDAIRSAASPASPVFTQGLDRIPSLVRSLTKECGECHFVSEAGFEPVQADQKTLNRADFDHGPHRIQASCASCHPGVFDEGKGSESLNLPDIENCRSCHDGRAASSSCVTCHLFHPFKDPRTAPLPRASPGGGR